jgi:gas vesicle protein
MNRLLSFLIGAMMGAIFGASVAVMFAPMSGQELQGQIRSRATNLQLEVKQAAADKRAELEAQLAHLRAQG